MSELCWIIIHPVNVQSCLMVVLGKPYTHVGLGLGIQRSHDEENDVIMIETTVSVLYYVLQTRWWNGASTNHENSSIICPEWVKNWHRLGIEHSYKYVDKMISNLNKYCTVLSLPQCSYFHVNSEEYNWNISFVLTVFILVLDQCLIPPVASSYLAVRTQ